MKEIVVKIPFYRKKSRIIKLSARDSVLQISAMSKNSEPIDICFYSRAASSYQVRLFNVAENHNNIETDVKNYRSFRIERAGLGSTVSFKVCIS